MAFSRVKNHLGDIRSVTRNGNDVLISAAVAAPSKSSARAHLGWECSGDEGLSTDNDEIWRLSLKIELQIRYQDENDEIAGTDGRKWEAAGKIR